MPSKYQYNVVIRASLDRSGLSGAGSSVSKQLEQELSQAYDAAEKKTSAKRRSSLDSYLSDYQKNYDKVKKEDESYTGWWEKELNKRDSNFVKNLEANEKRQQATRRSTQSFADFQVEQNEKVNSSLDKAGKSYSHFGTIVKGALIGTGIGLAIGEIIGGLSSFVDIAKNAVISSIELAGQFELNVNALAVFAHGTAIARDELTKLDRKALDTPGLAMEAAEQGTLRLQALGFSAKTATDLVVGLGKQKILSGADNEALSRVILDITQLAAGGGNVGREIREITRALPTMNTAMTAAFGSVSKFNKALSEDPKAAFEKFADYLKGVESPAGGFINSLDKLMDTLKLAGRAFGEPLLSPLTDSFRSLTVWIDQNTASWRAWGQSVGDAIRGVKYFADRSPGRLSTGGLNPGQTTFQQPWETTKDFYNAEYYGAAGGVLGVLGTAAYKGYQYIGQNQRVADDRKNLDANLDKIEADYNKRHYNTSVEQFDYMAKLAEGNAEQLKRIETDKQNFLTTAAELAKNEDIQNRREQSEAQIKIAQETLKRIYAMADAQFNFDQASAEGSTINADTSTPFKAARVGGASYRNQAARIQQQIYSLFGQKQATLNGFTDDQGVKHPGTPDEDRFKVEQQFDSQIKDLKAQEIKLRQGQNNQLSQNIVANINYAAGNANVRAFFAALSQIEGGGRYTTVGGGQADKNSPLHPGAYGMGGMYPTGPGGKLQRSTAAGLYQETYSNWKDNAKKLNLTDFRDTDQQLRLALYLFQQAGGDLEALTQGDFAKAAKTGTQPWAASPFSTLKGHKRNDFLSLIRKSTGVGSGQGFSNFLPGSEGASDALTSDFQQSRLLSLIGSGGTPTMDIVTQLHQLRVAQARQAGVRQPELVDTLKEFGFTGLSLNPTDYKNGYNQTNVDATNALTLRGLSFGQEVREGKVAQTIGQDNKSLDLEKELELLQSIDLEREKGNVNLQKSIDLKKASNDLSIRQSNIEQELADNIDQKRLDQANALLDVNRDLGTVAAQNADAAFVSQRQELKLKQERLDLEQQITDLNDKIANNGQNDALKITVALQQQQLDILNEHNEAVIKIKTSEVEINRIMEIRGDKVMANVMDHLAQQKHMTDAISDGIIGIYEGIAGPMEQGIDKLTSKLGPLSTLFGGILKTAGRSVLTGITTNILGQFGLGGLANKINDSSDPVMSGLEKQDKQIDLLQQIAYNTGGGVGGSSSGFRIPGLSGSRLSGLGGIFGGAGLPGVGGNPGFNPSGQNLLSQMLGGGGVNSTTSIIGDLAGNTRSVTTGGKPGGFFGNLLGMLTGGGGLKGLGSTLGLALPGLGASLGSMLGGGSMLGQLAGGAGGLLLGGAGLAALAPGLFASGGALGSLGFLAPFLTNPFTIAAAAAIIPLAIILGIQAKRKEAEKQRSVLRDNAGSALDDLIAKVRGHRISPEDALTQAAQIKSDYTDQVSKLKDAKTRRIAMNEWAPNNILWQKMQQLQHEGDVATAAGDRSKRILPEFADGAYVRARRGGLVARIAEDGYDEMILSSDPSKAQNTAKMLTGFLANNPSIAGAGTSMAAPQITIYVSHEIDAEGMVQTHVETSEGVQKGIVKVVNTAARNKELNFPANRKGGN